MTRPTQGVGHRGIERRSGRRQEQLVFLDQVDGRCLDPDQPCRAFAHDLNDLSEIQGRTDGLADLQEQVLLDLVS